MTSPNLAPLYLKPLYITSHHLCSAPSVEVCAFPAIALPYLCFNLMTHTYLRLGPLTSPPDVCLSYMELKGTGFESGQTGLRLYPDSTCITLVKLHNQFGPQFSHL